MGQPGRVAVLGAAGFIGSHLAVALADRGWEVRAVDRRRFPTRVVHAVAETATLDLRSAAAVYEAVRSMDAVAHLAADMGGVAYFHGPADWHAALDNGLITNLVLQAANLQRIERLVYTSSACAYPTELQVDEGHAPRLHEKLLGHGTPDQLYGAEKLHGARMVAGAGRPGWRAAVLHTVFGPGQEATGPRAKFPPSVAHKALAAAATGEPVEVWGNGRQLRSYLPVVDAVDRLVTLLEADHAPTIVNVGAEGAVTCAEVAELCLDLVGASDAGVRCDPDAGPTGVVARDCSLDRWRDWFGEPTTTSLRDGFAQLIDSLREGQ